MLFLLVCIKNIIQKSVCVLNIMNCGMLQSLIVGCCGWNLLKHPFGPPNPNEYLKQLWFFEILLWQANVAKLSNLPNLSNWPWPMKESINLIGGLLSHVCQHDLFKCVQILNISWIRMSNKNSSNGWTLMVLFSFSGWRQIVQLPVFRLKF